MTNAKLWCTNKKYVIIMRSMTCHSYDTLCHNYDLPNNNVAEMGFRKRFWKDVIIQVWYTVPPDRLAVIDFFSQFSLCLVTIETFGHAVLRNPVPTLSWVSHSKEPVLHPCIVLLVCWECLAALLSAWQDEIHSLCLLYTVYIWVVDMLHSI